MGPGRLGLTLAYRLARRGAQVTVIEKEGELGGLAAGLPHRRATPDVYLEKFYHHLFQSDKDIIALMDELGLQRPPALAAPHHLDPLQRRDRPA